MKLPQPFFTPFDDLIKKWEATEIEVLNCIESEYFSIFIRVSKFDDYEYEYWRLDKEDAIRVLTEKSYCFIKHPTTKIRTLVIEPTPLVSSKEIKSFETSLSLEKNKNIGTYQIKNQAFKKWLDECNQNTESMTKAQIHSELKLIDSSLWASGFDDWWRQQSFIRGKPGRKKTAK